MWPASNLRQVLPKNAWKFLRFKIGTNGQRHLCLFLGGGDGRTREDTTEGQATEKEEDKRHQSDNHGTRRQTSGAPSLDEKNDPEEDHERSSTSVRRRSVQVSERSGRQSDQFEQFKLWSENAQSVGSEISGFASGLGRLGSRQSTVGQRGNADTGSCWIRIWFWISRTTTEIQISSRKIEIHTQNPRSQWQQVLKRKLWSSW